MMVKSKLSGIRQGYLIICLCRQTVLARCACVDFEMVEIGLSESLRAFFSLEPRCGQGRRQALRNLYDSEEHDDA